MAATAKALREVCGGGKLTCRFTHVYPDGPAPYFTILAPVKRGSELEQWGEKVAAADLEDLLAVYGQLPGCQQLVAVYLDPGLHEPRLSGGQPTSQHFRGRNRKHRRIARWTLPLWLYVSVTGVVIYGMLYKL